MSYALGFSPDFFLGEGEPYDRNDLVTDSNGRPASVYSAIKAMSDKEYAEMAEEVFQVEAEFLTPEMVLEKIQETDTCSNLTVPVEVWVDETGDYRVLVYDNS